MKEQSEKDKIAEINRILDEILQINPKWDRLQRASANACGRNQNAYLQYYMKDEEKLYRNQKITFQDLEDRNKRGWAHCGISSFLFRVDTLYMKKNQEATSRFAEGVKKAFSKQAEYCKNNSGFFKQFMYGAPKKSECAEMNNMIHVIDDFMEEVKQESGKTL